MSKLHEKIEVDEWWRTSTEIKKRSYGYQLWLTDKYSVSCILASCMCFRKCHRRIILVSDSDELKTHPDLLAYIQLILKSN